MVNKPGPEHLLYNVMCFLKRPLSYYALRCMFPTQSRQLFQTLSIADFRVGVPSYLPVSRLMVHEIFRLLHFMKAWMRRLSSVFNEIL